MQTLRVGLDERPHNRPMLAPIFGRHGETSLLQLDAEAVQIKKLFHAEVSGPNRLRWVGKARLDGPFIQRGDNLRQATQLNDGHVRAALQTVMVEKTPRCRIAQCAKPGYSEPFPFELLRTLD